ncbi:MAG: general secretion pathway protein GspK [Amphiplicatus sp.]
MADARIEARIAMVQTEKFKAKEALEAALNYAAWRIAVGELDETEGGSILQDLNLNGYSMRVDYSTENNKIDLNLSPEEAWRNFLNAAGVESAKADALAAQIVDWRDEDHLTRANGAEARDYARVKDKWIGDRPFAAVRELALVLEMTPELFDCLAPNVTILGAAAPLSRRTRGAQLSTAVRGGTPGSRFALEATAIKQGGVLAPQRAAAVFRITSDSEKPFERILMFQPQRPERGDCVLRRNIRDSEQTRPIQ